METEGSPFPSLGQFWYKPSVQWGSFLPQSVTLVIKPELFVKHRGRAASSRGGSAGLLQEDIDLPAQIVGLQKGQAALGPVFRSGARPPRHGDTPGDPCPQIPPPGPRHRGNAPAITTGMSAFPRAQPVCTLPGNRAGQLRGKPWHHKAVNKLFICKVYCSGLRTNTRACVIQLGTKLLQLCLSFPIDDTGSVLSREGVG